MKLSIITICLNNRDNLEKTIQSVRAQTWRNFEFIIVDGQSSDGTELLLPSSGADIVICEKDSGIYNAQNKGIQLSSGEYLIFLNAGDAFSRPETLETIFANPFDEDLVYCDILLESGGAIVGVKQHPNSLDKQYWRRDFLCHQAVFHKRTVFGRYGLYNESFKYVSDHELYFKILSQPEARIRHIPVQGIIYNTDGISGKPETKLKVYAEYRTLLKKYFHTDIINENSILRQCYRAARKYFHRKQIPSVTESANYPQRILMLNTSDSYGGAARATQRIRKSLAHSRFKLQMAVKFQTLAGEETHVIPLKSIISLAIEYLKLLFLKIFILRSFRTENPILHSPAFVSKLNARSLIDDINPDIIHLNWIGNNLMTIADIGKIKTPMVWTLHDMWAFCGAEHVSYDERYVEGYMSNNRPESESGFDLNRWVWKRKQRSYRKIPQLQIVCPSPWLAECAAKSALFQGRKIYVIPNGLDAELFAPCDRGKIRKKLNLPENKKILLFGAVDSVTEKNKGYDLLIETLRLLSNGSFATDLHLLIFGNTKPLPAYLEHIPLQGMGLITDDTLLAQLYGAADVTIVPSLIESFGQTASESLSCGTPVACFDTSGLKSVVDHRVNGYRAECYSPDDLAAGIEWICTDPARYNSLRAAARDKVLKAFTLPILAENYSRVYSDLLANSPKAGKTS